MWRVTALQRFNYCTQKFRAFSKSVGRGRLIISRTKEWHPNRRETPSSSSSSFMAIECSETRLAASSSLQSTPAVNQINCPRKLIYLGRALTTGNIDAGRSASKMAALTAWPSADRLHRFWKRYVSRRMFADCKTSAKI